MPPSKDYEKFNKSATGDISQAAFQALALDDKTARSKVRIKESCIPSLIPNNALLEIEKVAFHNLKFGDFVFVRDNKDFVVRRFLSFEVRGPSEIVVHVVNQKSKKAEQFRETAINGRIYRVEADRKVYDPVKKENVFVRFMNRLTHFGTSRPTDRLNRFGDLMGSMMNPFRKK